MTQLRAYLLLEELCRYCGDHMDPFYRVATNTILCGIIYRKLNSVETEIGRETPTTKRIRYKVDQISRGEISILAP